MKLYKFYCERNAESRENTISAFEDIIMEQNRNECSVFDNLEDAKKVYDSFKISASASKEHTAVAFFSFDGKLIEEAETTDEIYKSMIDDGESLDDIYYSCNSLEIKFIEVSAPCED